MKVRYSHLFALALALPLASCRIVGTKPDFSLIGDSLTPAVDDNAYVESKPAGSTPLASYTPASPSVLPPAPAVVPPPAPTSAPTATPAAPDKPGFFTKAYWADLFSTDTWSDFFSFSSQTTSHPAEPSQPAPTTRTAAPQPPATNGYYTVLPGDSLARIARLHNVPLANLAISNGVDLQHPIIQPGQKLYIPPAAAPGNSPRAAETKAPASAAPAPRAPRASATSYRVCAGDTLYRIAQKHGITLRELLQANKLNDEAARRVRVGTLLTIPAPTHR